MKKEAAAVMISANPPIGTVPAPVKPYNSTREDLRYSFKILFTRWKGSVYKLVWRDLLVWTVCYYILSFWYRFGMTPSQKSKFEFICRFCDTYSNLIPLTFVLGFYVNLVIGRWWVMWDLLPWPDNLALYVSAGFLGKDEKSRLARKTLMRYINLASVQAKCSLSSRVSKRFPTLESFVDAGLMTEDERKIMEELKKKSPKLYYVPLLWASILLTKARNDGLIPEMHWKSCMDVIVDSRTKLAKSLHIELVNIPLVYSQVVSLSVYTFSLSCLLGRQYIQVEKFPVDLYFPIFTALQLVFYWGWLKVAEAMIDPYGDDDADFDLNYYIDKNVNVSYMITEAAMDAEFPDAVKEPHWEVHPEVSHPEWSQEPDKESKKYTSQCYISSPYTAAEVLAGQLESTLKNNGMVGTAADLRRRHSSMSFRKPKMSSLPVGMEGLNGTNAVLKVCDDIGVEAVKANGLSYPGLREVLHKVESAPQPSQLHQPPKNPASIVLRVRESAQQMPLQTDSTSNVVSFRTFDIPVFGQEGYGDGPADVLRCGDVQLVPPSRPSEDETRC